MARGGVRARAAARGRRERGGRRRTGRGRRREQRIGLGGARRVLQLGLPRAAQARVGARGLDHDKGARVRARATADRAYHTMKHGPSRK